MKLEFIKDVECVVAPFVEVKEGTKNIQKQMYKKGEIYDVAPNNAVGFIENKQAKPVK